MYLRDIMSMLREFGYVFRVFVSVSPAHRKKIGLSMDWKINLTHECMRVCVCKW